MSRVRLVYFDCRGRIDPIRMLLELAKVNYSFEPVNLATWKEDKEKTFSTMQPFGQVPIYEELDETGKVTFRLSQSMAILRHVARKYNLYGDTDEQRARADEWADTITETFAEMNGMTWNHKWEEERPRLRAQAEKRLDAIERWFAGHHANAHHVITDDRFTLADVLLAFLLELSFSLHPDLLTAVKYPKLHGFVMNFFKSEGPIRDYVHCKRRSTTLTIPTAPFGGTPATTHQWN